MTGQSRVAAGASGGSPNTTRYRMAVGRALLAQLAQLAQLLAFALTFSNATAEVDNGPETGQPGLLPLVWPLCPLNLWPLKSSISGYLGAATGSRDSTILGFVLLRHSWSGKFGAVQALRGLAVLSVSPQGAPSFATSRTPVAEFFKACPELHTNIHNNNVRRSPVTNRLSVVSGTHIRHT